MTIGCDCHVNHVGMELSHRSLEVFSIEFSNSFSYSFCSRNLAGRFRSPKSKEEETSLMSEATPKQHNTTLKGVEKSSRNGSSDGNIHVQC